MSTNMYYMYVHALYIFQKKWFLSGRIYIQYNIVRDPGFYARPKRFPRPGVKHVRKMISGVTKY
jgi:hypothetical protein